MRPWSKDIAQVAELGRWLRETGRVGLDFDWVYFMEKAAKWTPERDEMLREEIHEMLEDEFASEDDILRRTSAA